MEVGTVVIICLSIIAGVIVLALMLLMVVLLIGAQFARKAMQEARTNTQRKEWN